MSHPVYALLRRLSPPDDPSSDAAVLRRFVQTRDEPSFELLVWRHGGLVLGVCRRMLRDEHLAEDAFQATFLILARKAGAVRGSLAGWLHQVARRVCLRARQRNPVPVEPGSDREAATGPDPVLSAELRAVLDDEIARLPTKQRLAVVLCYLQGRSTDDAAKLLNLPRGTVLSRLSAARTQLQRALARRGITAPVALFAGTVLTPDLTAEVCRRTTTTAVEFLHTPLTPTVSTQLAQEVLGMTARKAILGGAAALILTAGLGTGVGLVMAQGGGKTPPTKAASDPKPAQPPAEVNTRFEEAAKEKSRRLEQYARSEAEVTDRIQRLNVQRLKVVADTGGDVDPSVLEAKLGGIDKSIVGLEDQIASWPATIQSAEKSLEDRKAGRFADEQWYVNEVTSRVNSTEEVVVASSQLQKRNRDVTELSRRAAPDSELLKEAQKLVQAAVADLEKAREQVHPKVEADFKKERVKQAEEQVTSLKSQLKSRMEDLKSLQVRRIDLVTRIHRAKAAQSAQQLIDDEIEVLREIRKQVLRERLMLEMGLEDRK